MNLLEKCPWGGKLRQFLALGIHRQLIHNAIHGIWGKRLWNGTLAKRALDEARSAAECRVELIRN